MQATSGSITQTATVTVTNTAPTVATAASATPQSVNGTTTNLSVLGSDLGGEANLTYTWSTTGSPPALVNFSVNGTNAAKNVTATFTKAGNYDFLVTITDAGGLTATSAVSVAVNQFVSSIVVNPSSVTIGTGGTQLFSATAFDQFGNLLDTQPTFSWSATGGTIDSAGLFTAGNVAGNFQVSATNNSVVGNAAVTARLRGDVDGDGQVTIADVPALMIALTNMSDYKSTNHLSNDDFVALADVDGSGKVNNLDIQSLLLLVANTAMNGDVPRGASVVTSGASGESTAEVTQTNPVLADNGGTLPAAIIQPSVVSAMLSPPLQPVEKTTVGPTVLSVSQSPNLFGKITQSEVRQGSSTTSVSKPPSNPPMIDNAAVESVFRHGRYRPHNFGSADLETLDEFFAHA